MQLVPDAVKPVRLVARVPIQEVAEQVTMDLQATAQPPAAILALNLHAQERMTLLQNASMMEPIAQ